ncbi:MFS transporter [Saccharicrinis sp. FJH54]|uniref:MFS transporter n=1 Tax=Saccharicrinis sp. FJH54 TaxID=3344665 RepID=UPI0035D4AFC1
MKEQKKMSDTELKKDPDMDKISREQWKASALAGMASYLDAGSIVALGAGLSLFQSYMNLSNNAIGLLAAIGPNAVGCAVGAFIGGRLGDKLGRKRIYQIDLLVYAFGILLIAFALNPVMLFAGTFIIGVAVGADVPTSLAYVGEAAPDKARGKLLGFTQVAWSFGPVVVLWMAMFLAHLDILGIRIVFLHLFVVAMVTWYLRRSLAESSRWKVAATTAKVNLRTLFSGSNLKGLVYTAVIYLFWNLAAGTAGIFNPYIIKTLNAGSQAMSVGLSSAGFIIFIIVTLIVFMPHSDRNFKTRRTIWAVGAIMQVVAYGMLLFLPFTIPVIIANILMFSSGAALAGEAFYKVFSQELFPTIFRGTAQGLTFGISRTLLGVWSFFVPALANVGIEPVAGLLTFFLIISGAVGFFFMPDTSGKSLEQIAKERA